MSTSPGQDEHAQRQAGARRQEMARRRRRRVALARLGALGSLVAVIGVGIALVSSSSGGGHNSSASTTSTSGSTTTASQSTATTGTVTVPLLAYNVINNAPPSSSLSPSLYVPADEFSAQMNALKAQGWHAVTLNQLEAYWTHGTSLGTTKPIVITFDTGYASQYVNALPVLKQLGWVGVENLRVNGLPPTDGGLNDTQIRGLISAGWELDTEGVSQPDLTGLGSTELTSQIAGAKQTLHARFQVPVNWFSYPGGHYDSTVVAAVKAAGFIGATTTVAGWASPQSDRFQLPRVQVTGGTSPTKLLSQIAAAQSTTSTPSSSP